MKHIAFIIALLLCFPVLADQPIITAGMNIDGSTLSMAPGNVIQLNTSNPINSSVTQTVVNGSAGFYTWSEPLQGSAWKEVIIRLNGYTNVSTTPIVFTTPFTYTPAVISNTSGLSVATVSTSGMTIPVAALVSGYIILEGY